MRGRIGPWKTTAFLLVAAETAALFWAYYALNMGGQLRALESDPRILSGLAQVYEVLRSVVPVWLSTAFADFTRTLGLASPLHQAVSVGAGLTSDAGISSLGSAIVAPAYFAARRLTRRPAFRTPQDRQRATHWKIRPPLASVVEPVAPSPAVIQASL